MRTTLHLCVLSSVLLAACEPAPLLSEYEEESLGRLVLPEDGTYEDPTNAWSHDPDAVELGHKFFYDSRFSGPITIGSDLGDPGVQGAVSCHSCHEVDDGGADHRSGGPTSHGTAWTGRNSPTILNSAVLVVTDRWLFWDGRKDSMWSQALGPAESKNEHNGSRLQFAHVIFEHYRPLYEQVFGAMPDLSDPARFPPLDGLCDDSTCLGKPGDPVWASMSADAQHDVNEVFVNWGKALAAYQEMLVTPNSPFDEFMRGDEKALSPAAVAGAKLFVGRASCNECHNGPALSENRFHNLGVPQVADVSVGLAYDDPGRADGIPLVLADEFNTTGEWSDDPSVDRHLQDLKVKDSDLGSFKTPTLRNVSLTAPYMHNGSIQTLWDVLDFYRFGGRNDGAVGIHDAAVQPLALSDDDIHDIVAFLESLTGAPPADLVEVPELP